MVEEEVDEELLPTDIEQLLPTHEREASAELKKKLRDVTHQRGLDLALERLVAQPQDVEAVGVLQVLSGQVRGGLRQRALEVRLRLAESVDCTEVDMVVEDGPGPAVRERGLRISDAVSFALEPCH